MQLRTAQMVRSWPLLLAKLLAVLATLWGLQQLWPLLLGPGLTSFANSFLLLVGLLLGMGVFWRKPLLGWVYARRWRQWLWYGAWLGILAWLLGLAVFFVSFAQPGNPPESVQGPVAAIIVLGGTTRKAQPTPAVKNRLDAAYEVAQRFPQAVVVVSGGVDAGEVLSEGYVMGEYLRKRGVPAQQIVLEEASTSTDLNFKLTQPLLAARGVALDDPVVFVTNDFHVWRSARIAQRQGWQNVQAVGAATPSAIRNRAWLREYFAMYSSWLLGEM